MRTHQIWTYILSNRPGSIIVDYRVGWNLSATEEPLKPAYLTTKIQSYLTENNNYIENFFVSPKTVVASQVVDQCSMNTSEMG